MNDMPKVIIYTKSTCLYCSNAKELLRSLGISFKEILVDNDPVLREEIKEKYNWPTVPVILINGELIGGYDDLVELHNTGSLIEKIK